MTKKNLTLKIIFILIILILISAFIIEYVLGHKSCKLCIYQRIPYFLSLFLIGLIFYENKFKKVILLTLSLLFFISFGLAFYHFGIEQGFFQESLACTTEDLGSGLTKEEVLKRLKENSISCKNVSFRLFGLSLAAINTISSIFLSVIFAMLFINYEKN